MFYQDLPQVVTSHTRALVQIIYAYPTILSLEIGQSHWQVPSELSMDRNTRQTSLEQTHKTKMHHAQYAVAATQWS